MKEIKLSQNGKNRGLYVALVDDEDFEYLNQFAWCILMQHNLTYVQRACNHKTIFMHRAIMGVTDPKIHVDHIDGNGFNNCRSNLRLVTNAQNQMNAKNHKHQLSKNRQSRFKGVHWHLSKWVVRVTFNKKRFHIGRYNSEIEAAMAYNKFAKENFGEFARLNEI
jgi:hypothetical protein